MSRRPDLPRPLAEALMVAAGAGGGVAVASLGVPAGWLSGSMLGSAALAASGVAAPFSPLVRRVALTGSGIAIGSAVTPNMLRGLVAYPLTLALMALAVAAVTAAGAKTLERVDGWSRPTAFFASVPGALSYVFAVASDDPRANLPRIAVVQVLRVFLLMGFVPLLLAETGGPVVAPPPAIVDPPLVLLAIVVLGAAAGLVLERRRVAAGMMFGAMGVAAAAHASGLAPGRPPPLFIEAAQILIGAWIGARFIGFDWRLFARSIVASLGSFVLATSISALFAAVAWKALDIPFAQALLAYAPGGLEAMSLLSIALGLDPLFVSGHHLARFILISVALPIVTRRWLGPAPQADGD